MATLPVMVTSILVLVKRFALIILKKIYQMVAKVLRQQKRVYIPALFGLSCLPNSPIARPYSRSRLCQAMLAILPIYLIDYVLYSSYISLWRQ